jgi:2-oxoglutarate ferredoxin oxidoreductase subunit alpha
MLHFSQVWPISERAQELLGRAGRVTSVECNQTGQFAGLLKEIGVVRECALLTKYDGLPFTGEEIARRWA